MTETPKALVTIIIASYNHRHLIEQALQSLFAQDYRPLEVLVIDDGSSDGSGDFLETLQGRYDFRLIRRANGGVVSVINLGIRESRGDYVVIHASDDESLPGRLSGQVAVLERHPEAAFVSGNVAFVTEDGQPRGNLLEVTGAEHEYGFEELFLERVVASSVACLYRGADLRAMAPLDERYLAEDLQMFLYLTRSGRRWVQWAGPPVILYRLLFSSLSRTKLPRLLRQRLAALEEFADHPLYPRAAAQVRTALVSALAEQDKPAALRELGAGRIEVFSVGFLRVLAKLALPRRWHYRFKKEGRLA